MVPGPWSLVAARLLLRDRLSLLAALPPSQQL